MAFAIDFRGPRVVAWHATADGLAVEAIDDYAPSIYVEGHDAPLPPLRTDLDRRRDVVGTGIERWRTAWRSDPSEVLRVDVRSVGRVRSVAGWIAERERPGDYRLYDVDLSPGFRFCLGRGVDPTPERELRTLAIDDPEPGPPEAPIERLEVGGEPCGSERGDATAVLDGLRERLDTVDPDVLVLSTADLVPELFETAERAGYETGEWAADDESGEWVSNGGDDGDESTRPPDGEFRLGRRPGWTRLAGASSYESYGQVGHSPARYSVPGRAIVDRSNTFFLRETNLAGCLDLVERSWKPLQELAWASIGTVLTAIQIREARERGVLVPWKSWRHEFPKSMRTLDAADRGGFTFSPAVGVHEDVHELDFSSLYPNIIRTRNVSPEAIRCDCCDSADVTDLGYSVCDEAGYLPDVLDPLVEDRDRIKAAIAALDDGEGIEAAEDALGDAVEELGVTADPERRREALQGRSSALKWILVACFGYQGFSNAKFGRIECHEAINAFAREILLDAKERLEAGGWRVVHGIVDSLWVTAREGAEQEPLDDLAAEITAETGIRLEREGGYDWIAFVPRRNDDAGALTKYFGARTDGGYKYRGIECRQRSTPPLVADVQHDLIRTYDETRDPRAVLDRLAAAVDRLDRGDVAPERLTVTQRVSKRPDEYAHATRSVAALRRTDDAGAPVPPGQSVEYVVVDDEREGRGRVRLAHEAGDRYDAAFYRDRLLRAAESVLAPLGWRRDAIEAELAGARDARLDRYVE